MRRIDRLIVRAKKIKPEYNDIYFISNETGRWMVEDKEFSSLEEAEQYIDGLTGDSEDILIIVNDAGPAQERRVQECGKDQVKTEYSPGSAQDTHKGYEHGSEWGDRYKGSEYRHSWV